MIRQFFTLIEILLVIALVSLLAGVLTYQGAKMVRQQRFHTSVEQVVDTLRFAQEIMVLQRRDVEIFFRQTDEGIFCAMESDKEVSGALGLLIEKDKILRGIDKMVFISPEKGTVSLPFSLTYMATNRTTPFGTLKLTHGALEREISLIGHPSPIDTGKKVTTQTEEVYPEELRAKWEEEHEGQ